MPWPVLSLITVVLVFTACVVLTELLARTALAKALTGRSRLPRRRGEVRPPGPGEAAVTTPAGRSAVPSGRP
jgi:hypothetical protein